MKTIPELVELINNLNCHQRGEGYGPVTEAQVSGIVEEAQRELKAAIAKEREAVDRFLVPYRSSLPESWLDHFVEAGLVYFDDIGFVYPNPIDAAMKGAS